MIIIPHRKLVTAIFFIILFIISSLQPVKKDAPAFSGNVRNTVIIDAGHGLPDGGAVGAMGTIEATINLELASRVCKELKKKGYEVIMTRTTEKSLSPEECSISTRKKIDMQRRLAIINKSNADIFVSIHMNKFRDGKYNGAQVIYSENFSQSRLLAGFIQKELHKIKENKTKRNIFKSPESIFLMKRASIPAVIVECGFLSNFAEEKLLGSKNYQKKLSRAICNGIDKYYKRNGKK